MVSGRALARLARCASALVKDIDFGSRYCGCEISGLSFRFGLHESLTR